MNQRLARRKFTSRKILSALEQRQAELSQMGVRKIGLFGSYQRGEATSESDMDFLVTLEKPSFDSYMNVKFFLEDLFGRPVDLVLEETIKPRLRPQILSEVVYAAGL
jgi:predicted nucleotidyltransferase